MARYEREFSGMPAHFADPSGMDPNYGGGYGGMRMNGGRGRAPYGEHRLRHQADLGTEGGFPGIHGGYGRPEAQRFDPRWDDRGGVRRERDLEMLRDFNAGSPRFGAPRRGRYDAGMGDRGDRLPQRYDGRRPTYSPRYTNRGITDAGYSEGWAFGPMRGAR